MKPSKSIEIKQLKILLALIKEKNLSKVAEQLGMSQQAVSEHLKKLRAAFNDRLFIRSGSGVQPTAFTVALQPKLIAAIEAVDGLLKPDTFLPASTKATFTLSCTDFEQVSLLPKVLSVIRKEAPFLKIAVKKLELDSLAADLKNGDVDVALTNPAFAPSHYPCETLYNEQYTCVASSKNNSVSSSMSIESIANIPQVVVSPSRGDFSGAIQHWFESQGHPRNVMMTFPTFSAAIAAIHSTDLCGFIPRALLPDSRLQMIEVAPLPPQFEVISIWHQRLSSDPLTQWIRGIIRDAARQ